MKWALTYTFNYDKNEAQFFESFDDAKQEAFSWSESYFTDLTSYEHNVNNNWFASMLTMLKDDC